MSKLRKLIDQSQANEEVKNQDRKPGMIIGLDFDGTLFKHVHYDKFPAIGEEVPHAFFWLRKFQSQFENLRYILWTMRSGSGLFNAVEEVQMNGLDLWSVNQNPEQHSWTDSMKAYMHCLVDDIALGTPLVHDDGRPYVDWNQMGPMLHGRIGGFYEMKRRRINT